MPKKSRTMLKTAEELQADVDKLLSQLKERDEQIGTLKQEQLSLIQMHNTVMGKFMAMGLDIQMQGKKFLVEEIKK